MLKEMKIKSKDNINIWCVLQSIKIIILQSLIKLDTVKILDVVLKIMKM